MQRVVVGTIVMALGTMAACGGKKAPPAPAETAPSVATSAPAADTTKGMEEPVKPAQDDFVWQTEQFGDVRILRYRVPGFDALDLKTKKLLYYLYNASLAGRDIAYDQNHYYGLQIRRTLEAILETHLAAKADDPQLQKIHEFAKQVWFSQGIFHSWSTRKLPVAFTSEAFAGFVRSVDPKALPLAEGQTVDGLVTSLSAILFDPNVDAIRVSKDAKADLVKASATNFYDRALTQAQVDAFYKDKKDPADKTPPMWGLNSQLAIEDGKVYERTWKVGGMYGAALEKMVGWLKKAVAVAENEAQRATLEKLVRYYETGDLKDFDAYNIAWVKDTSSTVDMIHGFIETYGDPLDMRGTYEAVLSVKDPEATKRIEAISNEASWFEAHSPIPDAYKKPDVKGISARVIHVVVGSGESQPTFPIGINLPNSNWIREVHGSKSVNLGNIVDAYDEASKTNGLLEEFAFDEGELSRARAHGSLADKLHTDMHEVIGHASGRLKDGVADPSETLKNYAGTIEEARADLVGVYFVMDQKLVDMGVMPSMDVAKAAYDDYFRNGLMVQLARIKPGEDIQGTHLRNRQLVAKWAWEKGQGKAKGGGDVVEKVERDGKTYFVVRDYAGARALFGELLSEIQRIKSEGDYEAAKALVEGYGVKVDQAIHKEVLARYKTLGIAPYGGFINPKLTAVEKDGEIVDVTISYPDDYTTQMLEYARDYSFLPTFN